MIPKLIPLLAAAATACSLHLAFAGQSGAVLSPSPAPANGLSVPLSVPLSPQGQSTSMPSNGWGTPLPTGDEGMLPDSSSTTPAAPDARGQTNAEPGMSANEGGLGIVAGGTSAVGSGTFTSKSASVTTQPKRLVPGVDTHPTEEETPAGVEIVRGPASD